MQVLDDCGVSKRVRTRDGKIKRDRARDRRKEKMKEENSFVHGYSRNTGGGCVLYGRVPEISSLYIQASHLTGN